MASPRSLRRFEVHLVPSPRPLPCLRRSACPPHEASAGGASRRQAAGERDGVRGNLLESLRMCNREHLSFCRNEPQYLCNEFPRHDTRWNDGEIFSVWFISKNLEKILRTGSLLVHSSPLWRWWSLTFAAVTIFSVILMESPFSYYNIMPIPQPPIFS